MLWRLGRLFEFGFDVRWNEAEVDLDYGAGIVEPGVDGGGIHVGLMLGLGWGS